MVQTLQNHLKIPEGMSTVFGIFERAYFMYNLGWGEYNSQIIINKSKII